MADQLAIAVNLITIRAAVGLFPFSQLSTDVELIACAVSLSILDLAQIAALIVAVLCLVPRTVDVTDQLSVGIPVKLPLFILMIAGLRSTALRVVLVMDGLTQRVDFLQQVSLSVVAIAPEAAGAINNSCRQSPMFDVGYLLLPAERVLWLIRRPSES